MYKKVDPKLRIKMRDLELVFSSGATLKFAYLDKPSDKYNFQGAELTFIGLDEIQQLDEENVIYMLSRLRSTTVDYKKQIYATGNPDYDAFIRKWVEFALDERGIPVRKDHYPLRYFLQVGGEYYWADTLKELEEKFNGTAEDLGILSFSYIPGNIFDNPILIKENPGYLAQLKALPRVERERLLDGSWYARASTSGLYKREWSEIVPCANPLAVKRVRSWDLAFTQKSESYDSDWTRGVLMSKDKSSVYTVEDLASIRDRAHKVEQLIFQTAKNDGTDVIISIPIDPNGSAGAYARDLQRRLSEVGYICRLQRPVKSKITRFAPFGAVAEAGYVQVVEAEWNKEFFTELEQFGAESSKFKDDICDSVSDAFALLNKATVIPDFSLSSSLDSTTTSSPIFTGYNQNSIIPHQSFQSLPTFSF